MDSWYESEDVDDLDWFGPSDQPAYTLGDVPSPEPQYALGDDPMAMLAGAGGLEGVERDFKTTNPSHYDSGYQDGLRRAPKRTATACREGDDAYEQGYAAGFAAASPGAEGPKEHEEQESLWDQFKDVLCRGWSERSQPWWCEDRHPPHDNHQHQPLPTPRPGPGTK
jgi:hypothetical protein